MRGGGYGMREIRREIRDARSGMWHHEFQGIRFEILVVVSLIRIPYLVSQVDHQPSIIHYPECLKYHLSATACSCNEIHLLLVIILLMALVSMYLSLLPFLFFLFLIDQSDRLHGLLQIHFL